VTRLVTSRRHPLVAYARSLRERRMRERERAFLVEGPRTIADAIAAGFWPKLLYFSPHRAGAEEQQIVEEARKRGISIVAVSDEILQYVADTVTPQAVIAVFPFPSLEIRIPEREALLLLVVDRLQDPGNLGTLLRSALGAGAHAAFLTPGTVDPFNAKVVRAAAGSHFRLPIEELAGDKEAWIHRVEQLVVGDPRASLAYDELDWTRASALVIGSEAHGVSPQLRQLATHHVAIPLRGGLESLNAAVAGSVMLFEAARQRRMATRKATTRE